MSWLFPSHLVSFDLIKTLILNQISSFQLDKDGEVILYLHDLNNAELPNNITTSCIDNYDCKNPPNSEPLLDMMTAVQLYVMMIFKMYAYYL